MLMTSTSRHSGLARREDGFTMLFAILVLLVGGLLVAGAFAAVNGDIKQTRNDTSQKKAYYAALAGIEQYKQRLNSGEKYWFLCPTVAAKVTGTTDEAYTVKTLPATNHSACEAKNQLSVIEGAGLASGTFRIESTGTSGAKKRSIVATFTHPGFTNYVYFSNYEVEDPANFKPEPTNCEHYYAYRVAHNLTNECGPIEFIGKDKVNGPLHTNDAADVCAEGSTKPTFGRTSADAIEMNGGHYSEGNGCSNSLNLLGTYSESAATLLPPETDEELLEAAGDKFSGKTVIELKAGSPNTMLVSTGGAAAKSMNFPTNGVIFVENASTGCNITYSPFNTDYVNDTGCGNVYVSGTYTEPLTIAAANDVIINGDLTTATEPGGKPKGSATLGLIATNFVRVYHPVKKGYEVENKPAKTAPAINEKCITLVTTLNGKVTKKSTEITNLSSTAALAVGQEVTGTGIPSGTTITKINGNKTSILIKNAATVSSESTPLSFYTAIVGYEYNGTLKLCIEKTPSGYTLHESELLFSKSCESNTTYTSKGFCEYENTSSKCSPKATNLNSTEDPGGWGALESPEIDAAILSTHHSFIVDNYKCGGQLGELDVWGSIAQFWRGPVGTGSGGGTGYIKNYNYDDRLATLEPPSFLSSTTSWKISRETSPPNGFG